MFHRSYLRLAWQTAWRHKRLWILGLLAGLINNGGMLNIVFRAFHRASGEATLVNLFEGSQPGGSAIILYLQKLALVAPTRLGTTVAIIILALVALLALALCAEASLIKSIPLVDRGKKPAEFLEHKLELLTNLFGLNALTRLGLIALTALSAWALFALATNTLSGDALVTFAIMILFVPLTLLLGYFGIFGAIEIVAKKQNIIGAVVATTKVLTKHWLTIAEMAVVLFLVNLLASLAVVVGVLILSVPYLIALSIATSLGSGFLWLATITLGAVLMTLYGLAVFGMTTTFTYAAWYHAYAAFNKRQTIASKLERLLHHFFPL